MASVTEVAFDADLAFFLRLARRGVHPAASGGEHRAAQLAKSMVEHVPGTSAIEGLKKFIDVCRSSPEAAREMAGVPWE